MGNDFTSLFTLIIGLTLSILIARAIFSIPTIVKQLKAQTKMLNEMAKTLGVDPEVIDAIRNEFGIKDRDETASELADRLKKDAKIENDLEAEMKKHNP